MKELSLHILDIIENSVRAEAIFIEFSIIEDTTKNLFIFQVKDNGKGMSSEFIQQVRNPFTTSRTTRKVGLGIPLLDDLCKMCNGVVEIESTVGVGTTLKATMEYNHIDRIPLGDMASTMVTLILSNPEINFHYTHEYNERQFVLDTKEVKNLLEGVPISELSVVQWLKEYIIENLSEIRQ